MRDDDRDEAIGDRDRVDSTDDAPDAAKATLDSLGEREGETDGGSGLERRGEP